MCAGGFISTGKVSLFPMAIYPHSGALQRVSRQRPCPICGKPDWCSVADNGDFVICARIGDGAAKPTRNGGFLHILVTPPQSLPRASTRWPRVLPLRPEPSPMPGLGRLAVQLCAALDPVRLHRCATSLGVSAASLRRLRAGWDRTRSCWSFPMFDSAGSGLPDSPRSRGSDRRTVSGRGDVDTRAFGASHVQGWRRDQH